MKYHYVYETTNNINGKKYIGKRTCNCEISEDNYLGSGVYFRKAIKKYGKDNFTKKILEICESEETAFQREIYYIEQVKAYENKNYYNIASGGQGGFRNFAGKTEEELNLWKKRMSESRKGRVITPEWKAKILETKIRNGTIYSGEKNPMYGKKSPTIKAVIMISFEGAKIKEFESIMDADLFIAKKENKEKTGNLISRVCINKQGTAYGYFWLFKTDYNQMKENNIYKNWVEENVNKYVYKFNRRNNAIKRNNTEKIYQLECKTLKILNVYDSINEASKLCEINSSHIVRNCEHKCNTAYGYSWCYKDEYDNKSFEEIKKLYSIKISTSEKYRKRPQQKIPIYCVTTNQKFDGAIDAVNFFGLCKGTKIQAVCKGERKYAGRHPETNEPLVWMYYKDYLNKEQQENILIGA